MSAADAIARGTAFLATARNADGAWGYTLGQASAAEPTVLCAAAGAGIAGPWLASHDLSFGVLLLPAAIANVDAESALRDHAVESVLKLQSTPIANGPDGAVDLDAEIVGWAWLDRTFGWVEPTSYAIVSLRRVGKGDHARCLEGQRFLRDRQCRDGGWNYGNPVVLDQELPADIAPTAWASLALGRDPAADQGLSVVLRALEHPSSLGLGAALLAWTGRPENLAPRHASVQSLVDALVAKQRDDGSFGGRVDWTALAVIALTAAESATPHVFAP